MCRFFIWAFLILPYFLCGADIAVVTLAAGSNYKDAVKLGIENKQAYCEKHGYDFICCDEILDTSRPIPWSKVLLLLQTMENSEYKWIFWTDADSLIMNQAIKLEDIIDDDYNLIISKDHNVINSGHFLIKNHPWSRQFLLDIYAHTECINHPWWENQALILEFEQKAEVRAATKLIPQRIFNSYPEELGIYDLVVTYQQGDFIVHFAGFGSVERLQPLFEKYARLVIDDPSYPTLDQYLGFYGFRLSSRHSIEEASPPPAPKRAIRSPVKTKKLHDIHRKKTVRSPSPKPSKPPVHSEPIARKDQNEGYMTSAQKEQFSRQLQTYPNIRSVSEVGLNGGHSAANFFANCPELETFVSFDLQEHAYARVAKEYFYRRYKNKFSLIAGDSAQTIPNYSSSHPDQKFDLIYVDGCHTYEHCVQDILHFQHLAASGSILWVDDFGHPPVKKAVAEAVAKGVIQVIAVYSSDDPIGGGRSWVEARYL